MPWYVATSSTTWEKVTPIVPRRRFWVGSSINYPESLASLEANSAATMDWVRVYDGGMSTTYGGAAHAGQRGVIYSCKPNMLALAAEDAAERAKLTALVANIPAGHDVWLCLAHEPENGDYVSTDDKAAYRAAWRWFADMVHATGRPELRTCWIMMSYSWVLGSGRDPETWYPGDDYIDYVAADTYNEGSLKASQRWDSWGLDLGVPQPGESLSPKGGGYTRGGFVPWAENRGKPWILAEWGSMINHNAATPAWATSLGVPATKQDWLRYGMDWLAQFPHFAGITLFNSLGRRWEGDANESWNLANGAPATYQAWGEKTRQYARGDLT